jgi:hypothetical protein
LHGNAIWSLARKVSKSNIALLDCSEARSAEIVGLAGKVEPLVK